MLKRAIDIVVSAVLLGVLWVPMVIIAWQVARNLGRPVLFRQRRPGMKGRLFELRKFRTMNDARDSKGALLADGARLTDFGRWLRASSLDELPSLLNVLRGDMSLVGPRPLLTQYLDRYDARQGRRHDVRPGITGLAQVRGRNAISWRDKLELDVRYVETVSLGLDLKILALTVWKVARRDGITAAGEATMPEFMGSERDPDGV